MNGQTSDYGQPSERDLEIFAAVKIDCRRQVDVAAEFGLSQARVSQIVAAVRSAQLHSAQDDRFTDRAEPYVEWRLDVRRLEWLYENAIQCYRRSCEPARRERSGENARGEWKSTTTLHAAGNMQCLKLAGKLMELKWKLQDRQRPPGPHDIMMSDLKTIQQWLVGQRLTAQSEGRIPDEGHKVYDVVRQTLDELLGLEKGMPITDRTRQRLGRAAADYEAARESAGVTECESVGDAASPATSSPAPSHARTPTLAESAGVTEFGSARDAASPATSSPVRSHSRTPTLAAEPTDTTDNISGPPPLDGYIEDCWPQDVKDFVLRGYKLPPPAPAAEEPDETDPEKTADISPPPALPWLVPRC